MCLTITVTNLKSNANSVFRFKNETQAAEFRKQMEVDVYESKNKHIRNETPPPCQKKIVEQYVIYTSTQDLERVTIAHCQ